MAVTAHTRSYLLVDTGQQRLVAETLHYTIAVSLGETRSIHVYVACMLSRIRRVPRVHVWFLSSANESRHLHVGQMRRQLMGRYYPDRHRCLRTDCKKPVRGSGLTKCQKKIHFKNPSLMCQSRFMLYWGSKKSPQTGAESPSRSRRNITGTVRFWVEVSRKVRHERRPLREKKNSLLNSRVRQTVTS